MFMLIFFCYPGRECTQVEPNYVALFDSSTNRHLFVTPSDRKSDWREYTGSEGTLQVV
jgi:hypothetical protein